MSYAVVTLEYNSNSRIDLALPLNIPCHVLADAIAEALKMEEGKNYSLAVKGENGVTPILPESTLGNMEVLDGFILQITQGKTPPQKKDKKGRAYLETTPGRIFKLDKEHVTVGRNDAKRRQFVDVDLSDLDPRRAISRNHAILERRQGQWIIVDQKSNNYTLVNGHQLVAWEPYPLKDGDEILFAKNGVVMKFVNPED